MQASKRPGAGTCFRSLETLGTDSIESERFANDAEDTDGVAADVESTSISCTLAL